jgi:cytoskeletal protein CcmA (bactofilin family)
MKVIGTVVKQDLVICDDTVVFGQVFGNIKVSSGKELIIKGLICGDIDLATGSVCVVQGMVIGNISNSGDLKIHGLINGEVKNNLM